MSRVRPARVVDKDNILNAQALSAFGLSPKIVAAGISYVYELLDLIDDELIRRQSPRFSRFVELANLSAFVGNLLREGIIRASDGAFKRNRPHTYPDIVANRRGCMDVEIKIALEANKPKGHLAKPGPHLTARYVLGEEDGRYTIGKENRGDVVWIWEMRAGVLEEHHFNKSNTAGDSGKTAVVNKDGLANLAVVYCDLARAPLSQRGPTYKQYVHLLGELDRPTGPEPPQ